MIIPDFLVIVYQNQLSGNREAGFFLIGFCFRCYCDTEIFIKPYMNISMRIHSSGVFFSTQKLSLIIFVLLINAGIRTAWIVSMIYNNTGCLLY
jgi:hypothetical protein